MTDDVLAHLREIMQKIEASRPHLFCRPEDKERVQAALDRAPWGGTANLYCSPAVPPGTVVLASPPASDLY